MNKIFFENKKMKKFAGFLICLSISAGSFSSVYGEQMLTETKSAVSAKEDVSPFEKILGNEFSETEKASGKVRIIVELEDDSLLENGAKIRSYSSVEEYLQSDEGKEAEEDLAATRRSMIRNMAKSPLDINLRDVVYEYSAVMNGFALETDGNALEYIRNFPGVKNAFIEEVHPLAEPVSHIMLKDSVEIMGGESVKTLGYTGKGTLVAVLDTGLSMGHEAFADNINMPKYDISDIEDIINNNRLTVGKIAASSVYKGEKIPFAFDYAGNDTNVSGGGAHGTHVAGIVGANGGEIRGVAPDAQLAVMKIFGDGASGAYDSDIIAGLEDSVKLGADVINMSLGTDAGFASIMPEIYGRVNESGINLLCAAGNAYSSTYRNKAGNDLPHAENPDNGIVGSPSTYGAALSVASMNNTVVKAAFILTEGRKIRFNDNAEGNQPVFMETLNGTYEYLDCGYGASGDFTGLDLRGKIALIQRAGEENGEILTFAQKEKNAVKAGAVAMIVYNNVDGEMVSMATDYKIPAIFINMEDGLFMKNAEDKKVLVDKDNFSDFQDAYSGKMSDFSSWGTTLDLKIKPEITAPGGNIYSALPNGRYGNMSGTSMASPHMAGAAAIMAQYIRSDRDGLNMTQQEIKALANKLMMSTAVPVRDEKNVAYSPRKQGAGLVQLHKAILTKAYLSNPDDSLPKGELGESLRGEFGFGFKVNSFGDENITYQVEVSVLTEDTVIENGKTYIAQQSRKLDGNMVNINAPSAVTLEKGGSQRVDINVSLTPEGKSQLESLFPNGIYIEGFVTLTPVKGDDAVLSYPFMGFFGSWADVPIFDASAYDDREAHIHETVLGLFNNSTGGGYYLGRNTYVKGSMEYNADKIAIKGKDKTKHVTAAVSLLRNVEKLEFSVENAYGETVYSESKRNESKTYYHEQNYHTPMAKKGWIPYDDWGYPLPDGNYTYKVTGTVGSKTQSISFPIVVDTQEPKVLESKVYGDIWCVKVQDNHYIQAMMATTSNTQQLTPYAEPDTKKAGDVVVVLFDLKDPVFAGLTEAKIALVDYADNTHVSNAFSLADSGEPLPDDLKPYLPGNEEILAYVSSPEKVLQGENIPFVFSLENMERAATVSFEFEKDEGLDYVRAEGKNGFSLIGVKWDAANPKKGSMIFSYLKDGSGGSYTNPTLADTAELVLSTAKETGKYGVRLTNVTVTGYDKNGEAVYLKSQIKTAFTETNIEKLLNYDLNGDGKVDLLDITFCQKYYQKTNEDINWSQFSQCDLDGNGAINISDLIMLAAVI